ncbi:anti-sigma factor RsbA family regulatory protein [Nocardia sp. NPDC056100]|uniref:anti-sigma factor RsbA family regulatory protein n=1 Tax=Nocardia sp. NPDC056100 TaxID=3345712 RepID=UPI0035D843C1
MLATVTADDRTEPFEHPALFYRDADEYLSGTLAFIYEGLVRDEPVAVAVPTANLELIRAALGASADAVRLMDMTVEGRNPGRIIPGVLRAFTDTHPGKRVRIVGEPVWADRSESEYPACAQHEALINTAFAGREVSILCPYNMTELPAHMVADAHATHPILIDHSGRNHSGAYDPDSIVASYNRPLPAPPADAMVFEFEASTLTRVRHAAMAYARDIGMSEYRLVDAELIIAETITNSVVHGGGRGTLSTWTRDGQLCLQVHDAGHITNPLAGRLPAPPRVPGGRGLLLVNQLAELVRIHTGPQGTVLHLQQALI